MRFQEYRIKSGKINHIFISHLHGDHYFGLIGLITTYNLLKREKTLHIYGPPKIKEIIHYLLSVGETELNYEIVFHDTHPSQSQTILEQENIYVKSIPLNHRGVHCTGFIFREKEKGRKIVKDQLEEHQIPYSAIDDLRAGKDFVKDTGDRVGNEVLTTEPPPPRSYAFCSDTAYYEKVIPIIQDVDVLYHEATFSVKDKERAAQTYHSTAHDAANIAKLANAQKLLIGHFSAKYKDIEILRDEAREVFPDTELALEGKVFPL